MKGAENTVARSYARALVIAFIEIIQLLTLRGSCDIDDLILNLVGVSLGYALFVPFAKSSGVRKGGKDFMDYHSLMGLKYVELWGLTEPDTNSLRMYFAQCKVSDTPEDLVIGDKANPNQH